jgi:hypothetical protein
MGRPAVRLILCLQSSARPFALILFSKDLFISSSQAQADSGTGPSILGWQRTSDNPTPSVRKQESRLQLNRGELVRRAKKTRIFLAKTDVLHRSRCRPYSSCLWWWYTSCWSSGLWQSVSIWSNVRTYKSLEEMAPEDQPWAKVGTPYSPSLHDANNRLDALLLHQPSLPLPFLLSSWPVATASPTSPKSLLSSLLRHLRLPP